MKAIWHSMEAIQVLKELSVDPHQGLTDDEIKRRLNNTVLMS